LLLYGRMGWSAPEIRVTFLQISCKLQHHPRTWLYLLKANETLIPTISCLCGNSVNFSCTSWIHFCAKNMSFCPFKSMGCKCQKIPQIAPSSWGMWTPSNTWMPGPTPLTTPNDSSISSHTNTQLYNKFPLGYNGTPQIHPQKCPFLFDITTPSNTTDPTHHLKWHLHPFSHFATVHFTDRQTNRLTDWPTHRSTDGLGDRSVTWAFMITI